MRSTTGAAPSEGITDSVRSFLASWVAVIKTRVEIISVEIEEQRERLEQVMLIAIGAVFCLSMGMILLTLFFVVLFWEKHPLAILGAFTVVYLSGGIFLWLTLRHKIKTKPRIFSSTAAELGKDYNVLQPRTP